jgi:dynein heavy chain
MKRKEPNNAFEKLSFPSGMTYGHRSSLRKECSRFLRFAYLVDFISLEALANIYKNSVEDMINRLYYLDAHASEKLPEIMKMEFDDASGNGQAQRGYEPLFHLNVILNDSKAIPVEEIGQTPIDDFILPTRGTSTEDEFDLLAHLELEPIKNEEEEEEEEIEAGDVEIVQLYKKTLPNIHNFWIRLEPERSEFKMQI